MLKTLQIRCGGITAMVKIDDREIIRESADVFKKFRGQSIGALTNWAHSNFRTVEIFEIGGVGQRSLEIES